MASNIYTKNEILQALASKGYFIDIYTLDTFFAKWNIEAIFEDEQGGEFFDKNTLTIVLNNLFNKKNEEEQPNNNKQQIPDVNSQKSLADDFKAKSFQNVAFGIDSDTKTILSNISISDSSSLIDKVQDGMDIQLADDESIGMTDNIEPVETNNPIFQPYPKKKKMGILEGAMQTLDEVAQTEIQQEQGERQEILEEIKETEKTLQDFQEQTEQIAPKNNTLNFQEDIPMPKMPQAGKSGNTSKEKAQNITVNQNQEASEYDDISLLSDSLEVQEKFREIVVDEFAKQHGITQTPPPPSNNEFKLDISERTINMIAKTLAKKIAKHISSIYSTDAKAMVQLEEVKQENKRLEQKTKDLENQNRKLRLLLAESNKNLNSYKPSIFGLYKKVPTQ